MNARRRAGQGATVAVEHAADVVPAGELVRDIRAGLADLHAGRVVSAEEMLADLRTRGTVD